MDYGKPAGQAVAATPVLDAAHANEYFELFVNATSMKHILGYYRGLIDCLHIRPNVFNAFYPKLKANLTSWRAKALLKKFDTRASHKCYLKGKAASNTRVLVIGGGPCGLRTAIEAQLLGAKVVVVEKRDRYSRNNVLHLWPFVIEDLRMLGAKKFFGKFCAGAIDHISIRQLQCILLKCALLLGVEVHTEVGFASLIEPEADMKIGWRAEFKPSSHPVSQYEFDVIIGADGKRNTLQGFSRKEFRGKLAIAITANFINKKTEAEASVEEISGVAFIFNQKFFKDLQEATRIDLENIVYYKDDTHYFVMTAKKHSLIEKGVIKQDFSDTERLLAPENVDKEALQNYAIEAANFSTNYQMPNLEFAVNHYGQPDVAMFDFTSMYAAENASKVLERNGYRLLNILVGDSLLEPFWPTGSGCARGFLSSLDAAWAIRSWSMGTMSPLETLAERESIYRLLAQTTPDNLNKDWKSYTLDPATRYPNLNKTVVLPHQVICLYDADNPASIERMKRNYNEKPNDVPKKRRRGNVDNEILLNWLKDQLKDKEDVVVTDMASVFKDGKVLCAIIHHYRPDLLDYSAISQNDPARNNQIAVDILEKELCIPPVMTGTELSVTEDYLTMATYLTEIYHSFRGEIPFIKHPKLKFGSPKPINLIETIQYHNLRNSTSPCKKCYKAYHSKLVFYSSVMEKKLLAFNRTCESVIVPSFKNSSHSKRSSVEIVYENSACTDRKLNKKRLRKMDSKRPSKANLDGEFDKHSVQFKKSETCLTQEELQRKCIERIYSKHDKLKRFLTKLLLKKKNSNTTNQTQINQKNDISSQTIHFMRNSSTQVDKVKTISAQTDIGGDKNQIERLQQAEQDINNITDNFKRNEDNPLANSAEKLIKIHFLNRRLNELSLQTIHYASSEDLLTISSKFAFKRRSKKSRNRHLSTSPRITTPNLKRSRSQKSKSNLKRHREAEESEPTTPPERKMFEGDQIYSRVSNWICSNDFDCLDSGKTETFSMVSNSKITDITSVSKMDRYNDIRVEERTDVVDFSDGKPPRTSEESFVEKLRIARNSPVRHLSKTQYSPFQCNSNLKSTSAPPRQFSVIVEGEEGIRTNSELPPGSTKMSEVSFKTIKTTAQHHQMTAQPSAPSARHRHKYPDAISQKLVSIDRKPRKRRTMEKIGASVEERQKTLEEIANNRAERQSKRRHQRKLQTEQFLKSMQMLQANAKPDSQPFEDYSIFLYRQTAAKFEDRVKDLEKQFTYIPDHDGKHCQGSRAGGRDEDIAAKIKHLENKWRQPQPVDKKPRDLLRAIGKIETSDWNIKEIEKKIQENKMGKPSKAVDKEKVPKWSKEQFLARQTKMEKKHLDRQESCEAKFADIDRNIKNLDQKLKEGTARELGTNKVASITEKLVSKIPPEPKPPEKHPSRPSKALPKQSASEFCHFCNKRVYLMEKLSAEGRFFHHGCFKCQYCHVQLRLGSYAFDRDGLYGYKFFCLQHFGMSGELPVAKVTRKPSVKRSAESRRSPEKKINVGAAHADSTDKVQTPERIEFSNLSSGHISSDQEDSLNQMDEDEWTDKNFGGSCAEFDTDDDSSSMSDSESDDADAFGDALEEPVTKEGTLKWAERWKNSYRRNSDSNENLSSSSSDQSSYYDSSDDDESETATEGEEEIRARELRKQEVCVEPPIVHTDTGTDTEVVSDESSSAPSKEAYNSVTEISTDSEFAQDEPTPTRELPSILLNDFYVTKTRGSGPKRIQVKSRYLEQSDTKTKKPNIELKLTPLVPSAQTVIKKPAPIALSRPEGYTLNRTQSTGGIAAKVSLELKKKYLLGEPASGGIQKSGSVSTLDTKFKSFHTNISDCQKLLKPSKEISAGMQTFCKKLNELESPSASIVTKNIEDEKVEEPLEESKEDGNESEGRPRSPLHETFIVVPQFDWSKRNDSLTSDSLASSDEDKNKKAFDNIPTIEIFKAQENEQHKEEFIPDSLQYFEQAEPPKSITTEKKSLNQPKTLPNLENLLPEIHNSLHVKYKDAGVVEKAPEAVASSPESLAEPLTAALTETELSDWARDEVVSDDFEEAELDEDFKRCPQENFAKDKVILTESMQNVLSMNLDNIEFMDTGTETSSDDGIANSQNGYVLFNNEDEYAADSLSSNVIETRNAYAGTAKTCDTTNKPAELITVNNEQISSNCDGSLSVCISDKVTDEVCDKSKLTIPNSEADENSTVIESGTTTEENTLTDSTVKNVTECYNEHLILSQNNNINKIDVDEKANNIDANVEFHEHVQRLQSKVEFSNAKDSIDIRKTRRKSKPDVLQKPDLITEEVASPLSSPKYTPAHRSPDILYNKEVIKKERDLNQKLIQEMVMNKMRAENKSLERRKRNKTTNLSPRLVLSTSPFNPVVDVRAQKKSTPPPINQKVINTDFINAESKPNYKKRDKASLFLNKDQSKEYRNRRCTIGNFIVPPKVQESLPLKAKSIPNFQQNLSAVQSIDVDRNALKAYNSDPNILETVKDKGKRKSPEKKGFAQFITGIFSKKSPTGSKGLFSKLSPKSKKISKDNEVISQKKSMSEYSINRNVTPPPVPPLPTNYVRKTDESSDAEDEFKKQNNSSCDTLDCSGNAAGRRSSKSQRAIRQTQLKRHRMAQEIQRKLEETEVKTRELEERGVRVEKALRGEGSPDSSKDEPALFQEWFDLMRDRTELRRYERELTVRAQELELEDRHARLQHDLRERLSSDKPKNVDDIKVEESIIEEMIDIVQKRDSLVAEIEEDKKRYSCEYRDLEEQMLAKGLLLTSYEKSPQH